MTARSKKYNCKKLLATLCAFSGVFASGSGSFAAGNKAGKKGTKTHNVKDAHDVSPAFVKKVVNLVKQHPVLAGLVVGTGVGATSLGGYHLGKAAGWWGKTTNPGGPGNPGPGNPGPGIPDVPGIPEKIVFGSSLANHPSLDFEAYPYKDGKWGKQYYYHSDNATNANMRKAILKELLFKNDGSEGAKKQLTNYLTENSRKNYMIFRLTACEGNQPGKYVIVFDASLFGKMTSEQKNAVKDNVYENGGFAVLGVEVQENKQNKNTNYNCTIKNLGELGYNFYFTGKYFIFNPKEDSNAVKNNTSGDSLSMLPSDSLVVFSSNNKQAKVKNDSKQKFIDSLDGFGAKAGDKNKKQAVYDNSVLYDIGGARLLVFNSYCRDIFCDLFKDKFVALGGYGFVVFEKGNQDKWSAVDFGDKYKITSRSGKNFAFNFEIAKSN